MSKQVGSSPTTIREINKIILNFDANGATKLHKCLLSFVQENSDPLQSPNYSDPHKDDLSPLAGILHDTAILSNRALLLAVVRVLKICVRKAVNRNDLPPMVITSMTQLLQTLDPVDKELVSDMANFILNVCYRPSNAVHTLKAIPSLISYLAHHDDQAQVAIAGALQGVCMHEDGKTALINNAGVPAVLQHLGAENMNLVSRCVGILHNISTAWPGVHAIRESQGLPMIITLLEDRFPAEVKRHAAAVLQNCSRDKASVQVILQHNAIELLSKLLFLDDLTTQLPATGALLNLNGRCGDKSDRRQAMKAALGQCIAVGQLSDVLADCVTLLDENAQSSPATQNAVTLSTDHTV